MKRSSITIKTFIKNFPKKSFCEKTYTKENITSLNELSHVQKARLINSSIYHTTTLKVTEDSIYFGGADTIVMRRGKTFFPHSVLSQYIYIIGNKVKISRVNIQFVKKFLTLCDITWWRDLPEATAYYLNKPTILKSILLGNIYNEETLYKAIAIRIFGIKNVSWKTVRKYILFVDRQFSFIDLYYYTKNIDESVNILAGDELINPYFGSFYFSRRARLSLYSDILDYAIKLNQVVDFTWSKKRLDTEHTKQIEAYNLLELSEKDTKPIYKESINTNTIKQLNTELDIYKEGINMHHCLYTCYYSRIRDHKYMAFHMTAPEDCTFSVRKEGDTIVFDQIFLKYDRAVKPITRDIAMDFVQKNIAKIGELLDANIKTESKLTLALQDFDEVFTPIRYTPQLEW